MKTTRSHLLLAVGMVLSLAGCADNGADATSRPQSTTSTTASAADFAMDWKEPFEVRLTNGWRIRDCEGDRLNVCIYDGDTLIGDIELNADYPLDEQDRPPAEPRVVARRLAADMIAHFRTDRAKGCGSFTYRPDEVADATVGGRSGSRGGFTLLDKSGRVVERVRNYYVVTGNRYAIVNIDAYAEQGGCLGPSEYDPSLSPENFATLEGFLDQLIAATPIPEERGPDA